jgi:hypothetical protein
MPITNIGNNSSFLKLESSYNHQMGKQKAHSLQKVKKEVKRMVRTLLANNLDEDGIRYGYECILDNRHRAGQQGVTVWGPASAFEIGPNNDHVVTFRCTHPKCYQGRDVCNVYFRYEIEPSSSTRNDVGPLFMYMMGQHGAGLYHSKIMGHDVTMAIDLAPMDTQYNDTGYNGIAFSNQDPQRTIKISNLRIIRAYGMCAMDKENATCCEENPTNDCWDNSCGRSGWIVAADGNLDNTRNDTPCNFEDCGGLSYTGFAIDWVNNDQTIYINPNSSFSWDFIAPLRTSAYIGPYSCLFNFNQIGLNDTAPGDDVSFTISLNGNDIATYYHSRWWDHNIFPTVELCDFPLVYNDTGTNTVTLKNNSSNVKLHLLDNGGVNVYRIYRTKKLGRNITASSDAHSTIDPSGSVFVLLNDYQQFWMSADQGYALNDVIVDSTDHRGPIPTYTFHNVIKDHTIEVTSKPHSDHTNNTPHTNYEYIDTAHSDYTYGDFSDAAHSDAAHEDAEAHSDVFHSDTSYSDVINHINHVDGPYYQDNFGNYSDNWQPFTDHSDHSNVSFSDTAHSDVGTGHADYTDHVNHVDGPYYQDDFGNYSDTWQPFTDHSDHSDAPAGGHADTPHSDAAHSDAGTYYDHGDGYVYNDYWGYPHSDIPHYNHTDHGNAGYTDHSDS